MTYKIVSVNDHIKYESTDVLLPIYSHTRMTEPVLRHTAQMALPLYKRVLSPAFKKYEMSNPTDVIGHEDADNVLILIHDACMCVPYGIAFPDGTTEDAYFTNFYLLCR